MCCLSEHLPLCLKMILEIFWGMSWNFTPPQSESHPGISDSHQCKRQNINQRCHDHMIPKHTHTSRNLQSLDMYQNSQFSYSYFSHERVVGRSWPGHVTQRAVWNHSGGGIITQRKSQNHSQNPHAHNHAFCSCRREAGLQWVDDRHVPEQRGSDISTLTGSTEITLIDLRNRVS